MRKVILAILLLQSSAMALAAGTDPLESFYGNTWKIARPEETLWIYVNPDRTWSFLFMGKIYPGQDWRVAGERVCLYSPQADGKVDPHPHCFRGLGGRKVGESWKTVVEGGEREWDCTLFKGRSAPPAGATGAPGATGKQEHSDAAPIEQR